MLAAECLDLGYAGRAPVLKGVDLELAPGTTYALLGPSGSGKSTLLKALCGLLLPLSGRVRLDDREFSDSFKAWQENSADAFVPWPMVSLVFQELGLFPNLTSLQNCSVGMLANDSRIADINSLAAALQITDCLGHRPRHLSQGQRQRVAILRALVRRPQYLLLDEPTAALDPLTRDVVARILLDQCSRRGMSVLVATHDLEFANLAATAFVSIRQGTTFQSDSLAKAISIYTETRSSGS